MTDEQFEKKMFETRKHHIAYLKCLNEIEEEYFNRFGNYPAAIDDDFWIDTFSQSATCKIVFTELIKVASEKHT